ncbi:cytochrome c oxidase assembly protein [Sphingosinithalassobacter tenebrarum]|uniref:Cytochrome c oxidase assembly protein n=2 Tax=Stakelama tenebrarum TaxID=2711215 RepID=A0A6G6Y3H1_9SPHN|nr:cytochrome c oxidase assembly protein [Sphingosinithalassobacter tenebrarum]
MTERIWTPYCGIGPTPEGWLRWNFDPVLLVALLLAALAWRHWSRGGDSRAAWGALGVTLFLFVSPFCAMGSALFTVRIVHDLILAALLAPLVTAALALQRRALPGSLTIWTAVHALTFWLWHAPPLYAAALSSDMVFWAMQISITGTAALWWAKVVRAPAAASVVALLATTVAMGVLGALIVFAGSALYAPHWLTTQAWGLAPLEDQQIAGIIMWAPASAVYLLAAMVVLYGALRPRALA